MSVRHRFYGTAVALSFAAALCSSGAGLADETAWPRLDKDSVAGGICVDALRIADAVFRSDSTYLYDPSAISSDLGIALVLQPKALDISEGDALVADAAIFQKLSKPDEDGNMPRSLYWQIKASHGARFALVEDSFGWRGDQYTLFAVKDDVTSNAFIAGYSSDAKKSRFTPLVPVGWRPPLVLKDKATGDLTAVDVGAPYDFLSDWRVYSLDDDGAKQRCTVHFHPQAKGEQDLLPKAVRRLATLLDGTLGSGEGEGTLQQTARVRIEVMHSWANVAMRPWAVMKQQPFDTRKVVDEGLQKWSHEAKSFGKLYRQIQAQYPRAERALAQYYRSRFAKTPDEARTMAKENLDIAYRMYFVFPG